MKGRRPVTPKKGYRGTWTDISCAPLSPGDTVIVYDAESENQHTFLIDAIEDGKDNKRVADARLIDTTSLDPNYRVGISVPLTFDPASPVKGVVIRKDARLATMDALQVNDAIVAELYAWLMDKPEKNWRMRFSECCKYLVSLGLVNGDDPYELQVKRVSAAIQLHPEYFINGGGHISGTGITFKQDRRATSPVAGLGGTRRIKINKLIAGVRLVLESGLFGDVTIDES